MSTFKPFVFLFKFICQKEKILSFTQCMYEIKDFFKGEKQNTYFMLCPGE